jgi:hypothetical protein
LVDEVQDVLGCCCEGCKRGGCKEDGAEELHFCRLTVVLFVLKRLNDCWDERTLVLSSWSI